MAWDYTIKVTAGDDVEAAVMAAHNAHIAKYPGVSQEHAILATPAVAKGAVLAAKAAAKHKKGTPLVVRVAGPNHYDDPKDAHLDPPDKRIHRPEITATAAPAN